MKQQYLNVTYSYVFISTCVLIFQPFLFVIFCDGSSMKQQYLNVTYSYVFISTCVPCVHNSFFCQLSVGKELAFKWFLLVVLQETVMRNIRKLSFFVSGRSVGRRPQDSKYFA